MVAPICSILSIALTLETTETLAISRAGSGSMVFGFSPTISSSKPHRSSIYVIAPNLQILKGSPQQRSSVCVKQILPLTRHPESFSVPLLPRLARSCSYGRLYSQRDHYDASCRLGRVEFPNFCTCTSTDLGGHAAATKWNQLEEQATVGIERLEMECGLQDASTAQELPRIPMHKRQDALNLGVP